MALGRELEALDPLLLSLARPHAVRIVSDGGLCRSILKSHSGGGKIPTPLPGLAGTREVVPAAVLMELAQASTPPLIPWYLRDLSLRWAWLRYCWTFAPVIGSDRRLRLSEAAWKLAPHHKQVAADQLGVGFGLEATRNYLERAYGRPTRVHDVEVALFGEAPSAMGFGSSGSLRPDYLIEILDVGASETRTLLYALECKGTHGGNYLRQLRKGLAQLAGLVDERGRALPGVVCSTCFTEAWTTLRLVDPEGADEFLPPSTEPDARAEVAREGERLVLGDPTAFRGELTRLEQAAVLSFAGRYREAGEVVPMRLRRRFERDDPEARGGFGVEERPVERRVMERGAIGTEADFPLADGRRLRVVTAVDGEILGSAQGADPDRFARSQREFTQLVQARRDTGAEEGEGASPSSRVLVETEGGEHLRVVAPEGRILELSIG
jgi:hypothetical protein